MRGKKDIVKGRILEASGPLIGDDDLHKKGKTDHEFGHVKQISKKVIDKGSKRMHS